MCILFLFIYLFILQSLLGDMFSFTLIILPWVDEQFCKQQFFYLILAGTDKYLVYVFTYPSQIYTQGSYFNWNGGSLKVPHFFNFYFQVFVFPYFIIVFNWCYLLSLKACYYFIAFTMSDL